MSAAEEFAALSRDVVDDLLAMDPVSATSLGDHRFDARLADLSAAGVDAALHRIDDHVTRLDAIDDVELDVEDLVDLEILRSRLLRVQFDLAELRPQTWNPMVWNPGTTLHLILARDFAIDDERRDSLVGRLRAIPEFLSSARSQLEDMPGIHVETAIGQLAGAATLIDGQARVFARDDAAADAAHAAVVAFSDWLADRLPVSHRDPRLGERLYSAALWHSLDDDITAEQLLFDAELHLDLIQAQLRDAASWYLRKSRADDAMVRKALGLVAKRSPVTDQTVLGIVASALEQQTAFVREHDLVTVPELDVRVVEMPEIHRGVAVAYCDAPGPLESAAVATYVAVAPTPQTWDAERVASFYREYNGVQLQSLTVHEAMPGHVLQLGHSRRYESPTRVRQAFSSGAFAEGWAVYAEALMAERGYDAGSGEQQALAVRLQQLKMQLRMTINAILDVRVHTRGMTEDEGMRLMQVRGHQEEGEAVGKWRRALLTSCQLSTYYVGYIAVNDIVLDLRAGTPGWTDRALHDAVLAHGSPPPRHLRTLLGI